MNDPLKYFCWKCEPNRTFLTAEAKARHMRLLHSASMSNAEHSRDPDTDAYYDWDAGMFRPGPMPKRGITRVFGWLRKGRDD